MIRKVRNPKAHKRDRRHKHIRHTVVGSPDRPRVCVFRSGGHIYAQIIDDTQGHTLAAVSSLKLDMPKAKPAPEPAAEADAEGKGKKGKKGKKGGKKPKAPEGAKILQAKEVGRMVAEVAKEKGITRIRFDRGGFLYHGRVAALAKAMRDGGLEF
jgi:large subunit ribosomal protein L18